MNARYAEIEHTEAYLLKDLLHELMSSIDTQGPTPEAIPLTVFNPIGRRHSGPVHRKIRIPRRFLADHYTLIDSQGKTVPATIRWIAEKQKDLESVYMTNDQLAYVLSKTPGKNHPDEQVFTVLDVDFIAQEVPAIGYKTWWILAQKAAADSPTYLKLIDQGMENNLLRIMLRPDGTFDLFDKQTKHLFEHLNYFIDRKDIGNAYDHHSGKVPQDKTTLGKSCEWTLHESSAHRITWKGLLDWHLPAHWEEFKRSADCKSLPLVLYVTLHAEINRVKLAIELDNVCRDHCLRVVFPTGLKISIVAAGDNFNVLQRKVRPFGKEWCDQPLQEFVDVSDGQIGLCLITKGLPAYEAITSPTGTALYLTLLRAIGHLGPADGADYPVPAAQCPGPHRFEYTLIPHKGDWAEGDCVHLASDYLTSFVAESDLSHQGPFPPEFALFELKTDSQYYPRISCLKQSEDQRGIILRLWNPNTPQSVHLKSSLPFTSASRFCVKGEKTPTAQGTGEIAIQSLTYDILF